MMKNVMARIVKTVGAAIFSVTLVGASVTPAQAEGWQFVRKVQGDGCFELLKNGEFYGLTNVCAHTANGTTRSAKVILGGQGQRYCMPQHKILHLGLPSEYTVSQTDTRLSRGCLANHAGGEIWIV